MVQEFHPRNRAISSELSQNLQHVPVNLVKNATTTLLLGNFLGINRNEHRDLPSALTD